MKQKIVHTFLEGLDASIDAFQFTLDELSRSVLNETKSTAGDKHETALAMLQAEQSRIAAHMYEVIDSKTFFSQIDFHQKHDYAMLGSLVETTKGSYLISVALPKIIFEAKTYFGISAHSPLGEQLIGRSIDDEIQVNGIIHKIVHID